MRVFIANFGRGNYAWEDCKRNGTVATMNDEDVQQFWLSNNRAAYIAHCAKYKKTARGNPAPKQLASRWFNLMGIIAESAGDLWIHRDQNQIWWTVTSDQPAIIDAQPRNVPYQDMPVFECHKPCCPWSNKNKKGRKLTWDAIHPKSKDFLTTESTLQKLNEDYSSYVIALINGDQLNAWHDLPVWRGKLAEARTQPVQNFSPKKISVVGMAIQAEQTGKTAKGQIVEQTVKNKEFCFGSRSELEGYLYDLLDAQDNICALTGLSLQFKGSHEDEQMLCSLDRIDSDGHYERGNLQIVCRFANFWKSNMEDNEFHRLLTIVREQ